MDDDAPDADESDAPDASVAEADDADVPQPTQLVFKATDEHVGPAPGVCPACAEAVAPDQRFCEACGEDLTPELEGARCVDCSAPAREIDDDGYCSQCGRKQPDQRDHLEIDEGRVAGVTDRGSHHHRNEDAFAVRLLPNGAVSVVCDGVSTTGEPQKASQAAADAAADALNDQIRAGHHAMDEAIIEAVADAQTAVLGSGGVITGEHPASCTIVAAVATADPPPRPITVTMGWLGDSRGYWVDTGAPSPVVTQLTEDDSWATVQVASGAMTEAEAMRQPQAHSITRWLGADAQDVTPRVVTHSPSAPGLLLLCSDGLWNYAATNDDMAARIADTDDATPLALAQRLTTFAIEAGGHDNITVIVTEF